MVDFDNGGWEFGPAEEEIGNPAAKFAGGALCVGRRIVDIGAADGDETEEQGGGAKFFHGE